MPGLGVTLAKSLHEHMLLSPEVTRFSEQASNGRCAQVGGATPGQHLQDTELGGTKAVIQL